MPLVDRQASTSTRQRRRFVRFEVQCRARIRIGTRQYAGYIHNIGQGGAKLRTISPIRKAGRVILRLPDLPARSCELRWTDSYNAGVAFEVALSRKELADWARGRSAIGAEAHQLDEDMAELEMLV